jgi:O-antigen/teichoic acid export membrane protein
MSDPPLGDPEKNRGQNEIDERIRNATRGISSLIVQNIINSLLGFVFLAALLRLLPAVDYGGYSGVQVSIGIASPIALLGFQYAAARYTSLKKQEEGKNWIRAARSVLALSLVTTTLATLVFTLLGPYLSLYYMRTASFSDIFELGALWLFSISISTIFQGFIQGLKKYSTLATYNAAVTVSLILGIVLITPLSTLILPEASSNIGNKQAISNVLRLSFRFVMLVLLPASFLLAGMSTQFISLFSGGGGYLAGSFPLLLIASFYVLDGFQIAIYFVLQALGKTTQALIIAAFTAGIDAIFAIILVPHFGLVGGAISKDLVAVLGLIVTIYVGRSYLRGLDRFGFYAKSILPSIGVFALVYGLSTFVANRALTLIPYSLGALIVFVLLVKALKLLSDEDRYFLSHILPKSLQRLVRSV